MRKVVPIAALLLVAACSRSGDDNAGRSESAPSPPDSSRTTPSKTAETSAVIAKTPPATGAPISTVVAWIEAGTGAELDGFHTASRDGVTTQLADGVAFTTPSGKTTCMTGVAASGAGQLACLTQLTDGPAQPADAVGEWISGWIDYPGDTLTVGGVHGDPGQFGAGRGQELGYGQRVKFGDYQCRADQAGLYCVNYARRSAARISDAGVVPFGCLREVDPPPDIGVKFAC